MVGLSSTAKFDALHAAYASWGYHYAVHLLGSHGTVEDAEDAVQNTFLNIYLNLQNINDDIEDESCKGYFFVILRNECLDIIKARRGSTFVSLDDLGDYRLPYVLNEVETNYEASEMVAELMQRIRGLPERDNQLLVDRVFYGLSYKELGQKYGILAAYAKVNVSRIRAKLVKDLASPISDVPLSVVVELVVLLWHLQNYIPPLH